MIFDKIEHATRYLGVSPHLDRALRWLMQADLAAMENGVCEIDGRDVFVNVMDAETNPDRNRAYEFHRNYYDIQVDITGREDVLFAMECEEITKPYQEDIGFGTGALAATVHLVPGRFVICEPTELHMPGTAAGDELEPVRKAVIKVRA